MGRYKDFTLLWSVEPQLDENIIRKGVTTNQWQSVGDVLEKSSYDWALHLSNMVSWKQVFKLCFRKRTERSYFQLLFTGGNATHLIYLGYFSCCFSVVIIQQTHCCCLHPNTRSTFMDRSERHWALWKHANLQLKVKVQHFLLWLFSRRKWFRQEVGKDDLKKKNLQNLLQNWSCSTF